MPENTDIYALLVQQNGEIGKLTAATATLTSALERHIRDSSEGRSKLYQRLEELDRRTADQITAVRSEASHVSRTVDEISKKQTEMDNTLGFYEKWRERGVGAYLLFVVMSGALVSAVVAAWGWVWQHVSKVI